MLDSDKRYQAYQLLMQLDKSTSMLMRQVAGDQDDGFRWEEGVRGQCQAFHEWIIFASSLAPEL